MSVRVSLDSIKRTCTGFVMFLKIQKKLGIIMVFDKEEALCIFLKRFTYPCRYQDLILRIGQRAVAQLCMISNQVQNIYENWVFLLRNINQLVVQEKC